MRGGRGNCRSRRCAEFTLTLTLTLTLILILTLTPLLRYPPAPAPAAPLASARYLRRVWLAEGR